MRKIVLFRNNHTNKEGTRIKLYAAIDLHANNSVLKVRQPNDLALILEQLAPRKKKIQAIAVESTFNWYWPADGLMEGDYEVKLVNTLAVKT